MFGFRRSARFTRGEAWVSGKEKALTVEIIRASFRLKKRTILNTAFPCISAEAR